MTKHSIGRIIGGVTLALLSAALSPLLIAFAPIVLVTPILIVWLYAWAGAIPAAVSAIGTLGMYYAFGQITGGAVMPLFASCALILPALGMIFVLRARRPFFQALGISIGVQLTGLLLTVFALRLLLGMDLVDAYTQSLRAMADAIPYGSLPGDMMQSMLLGLGRYGMFGTGTGVDFTKETLTLAEQTNLMDMMITMTDSSLRLSLLSMILSSGVLTGILSYTFAARVCARRGDEPQVPYKHVHDWYLRKDIIIGLPVSAAVCMVANAMGMNGADSASLALINLCYIAFAVQGAGAVARRLKMAGMSPGARDLIALGLMMFFSRFLSMVGLASAAFGSHGLVSEMMRKRYENRQKGDDE